MSEHTCKVIFDDSVARKWNVWCEGCRKIVAACTSESDAKDCLENHVRWQQLKEEFVGRK